MSWMQSGDVGLAWNPSCEEVCCDKVWGLCLYVAAGGSKCGTFPKKWCLSATDVSCSQTGARAHPLIHPPPLNTHAAQQRFCLGGLIAQKFSLLVQGNSWVSPWFSLIHKKGQKLKFQEDALEIRSCASTGWAQHTWNYGRFERFFPLCGWAPCCSCRAAVWGAVERISRGNRVQTASKPHNEEALLQWQSVSGSILEDLWAYFNFSPKLWADSFLWSTHEGQSDAALAVGGKGLHLPAHRGGTYTTTKQSAPRRGERVSPLRLCVVSV